MSSSQQDFVLVGHSLEWPPERCPACIAIHTRGQGRGELTPTDRLVGDVQHLCGYTPEWEQGCDDCGSTDGTHDMEVEH